MVDPNIKIEDNNKVKTNLNDTEIINLIGSRTTSEISKFRQNMITDYMATDYMKQRSHIEQQGILCCSFIEETFFKSMHSRITNIEEYYVMNYLFVRVNS